MAKVYSTNRIVYPYFDQGKWPAERSASDLVQERYSQIGAGSVQSYFAYRVLQMASVVGAVSSTYPIDFPVDPLQPYRVGAWGYDGTGVGINVLVTALDAGGSAISTLTVPLALPSTLSFTNSEVGATINAQGGVSPAWPSGTIAARFQLQNPNTGTNKFIFAVYAIPSVQLPNTTFTKGTGGNGGGTHEAVWDGSNLYTISHSYDQLAKFDANLNRITAVNVGGYPHDLCSLGSDIWVISWNGKSLQQINKSTMTVTNTYTVNGNRAGIGIATDGTDLFLGVGYSAVETAAIVKFTVATATQTQISTDVDGGAANIPVQYLAGSIWSTNIFNSEVKRIDPSTGATSATISVAMGLIYGLGNDGTLIYAQAQRGVAVIDPATDTVVARYTFSKIYGTGSNAKPDSAGRMWGCAINGVWCIDHANGRLTEIPHVLGAPKWVEMIPAGMALGYYAMPSIDVFNE